MTSALCVGRDRTSKPIKLDLLVSVIVLQDVAHALDHLHVLVGSRVEIVEGAGVVGSAIGQSEVDRDGKINFAAAEDVLEERASRLNL